MDLCKRKNEDKRWIDEIAAMQAFSQPAFSYSETSGIVLAGEDNESNVNAHVSKSDSSASQGSSENNQGMIYYESTTYVRFLLPIFTYKLYSSTLSETRYLFHLVH